MKLILLSGGSGTRLWPLSNDARSKQFLKILKNEEHEYESMVQRVWRQMHNAGLQQDAFITTSKSQFEMIQSQIEDCPPLIIEPERKDTFPAIALSVSYILTNITADDNEIVVVLPVDMYVEDSFFDHIMKLESFMNDKQADIALVGVTPTYPAEKYGYIVPVSVSNDDLVKVECFVEKPQEQIAEQLILKSALWNCGVFAFKLKYLKNILRERKISENFNQLLAEYKNMKKISFDFEVLEQEKALFVAPYTGGWKDLGTWDALVEEMDSEMIGKGVVTNSTSVNLINELDVPIVVMGLHNTIVVASPDGILVSDITMTPTLKDSLHTIKTKPMYEERRWGWFKVVDYTVNAKGEEVLTKRICIKKGKCLSYQKHLKRTETWNIIVGEGEIVLDDQQISVKEGSVIKINAGQKHSIRANEDLEIIEIQIGELVEEDIKRYALTWEEITKLTII